MFKKVIILLGDIVIPFGEREKVEQIENWFAFFIIKESQDGDLLGFDLYS